ncbi:MAG: CRTAC1 family protein [Acidobacteria bacterium]|nr:CRTAC1 family protein [Acidobacteriota bacterium]
MLCLASACLAASGCTHAGAPAPPAGRFHFVNVAAASGIDRITWAGRPGKEHLLDSAGTGAAFLDYDRDGRLDVYLVNGWRLEASAPGAPAREGSRLAERGRHALYRGLPDGTFRDVTGEARVAGEGHWGSGVAVADYDADGWPDLLITGFGPNVLYRNRGDGTFENVAGRLGIEAPGWNTGAAFFDAEGDGDLDLYVASYIACTLDEVLAARATLDWKGLEKVALGPFGLKGAPDHYFRSEGGRRFVDATSEAGLQDRGLAYGFAVRAADFDDDGDLDLYVANDSDPNYLYRNEGNGTFREVGVWSGCALDANGAAQASMGVAIGDAAGDGALDIFTTNFSQDFSTFYRGLGGGFFDDASEETGIGPATFLPMSWGAAFADFDNDSDLDLVVASGHIYPQIDGHPEVLGTFRQRNLLLENRAGRFVDVTAEAGPGFEAVQSSRGLAVGDYDNDGDVDILITNLDAPPDLLRNERGNAGSWLEVACEIPGGAAIPIGTAVTVAAGGRTQRRDIASGDSYVSSHDPRPHFGLGDAATADTVDVRWPDGSHTVQRGVAARRLITMRKGS